MVGLANADEGSSDDSTNVSIVANTCLVSRDEERGRAGWPFGTRKIRSDPRGSAPAGLGLTVAECRTVCNEVRKGSAL